VSWCSCCEEQRQQEKVFNGFDFPQSSRQDVESRVKECACLQAIKVLILPHSQRLASCPCD
jgi:hypothetical protein